MNPGAGETGALVAGALAFVVATDFELRTVQRGLRVAARARESASQVDCIKCGIACSTEGALDKLSSYRCVVSCGFAAGLCADVPAGTRLLPDRIVDADGEARVVSSEWHERFRLALTSNHPGDGERTAIEPLVHTDNVLRGPADKEAASSGGNLVGADMESALIAAACAEHGVPFVAVRIVLDPVAANVPQAVIATIADGAEPGPWSLVRELARHPRDWFDSIALAGYTLRASRALESAVTRIASSLDQ